MAEKSKVVLDLFGLRVGDSNYILAIAEVPDREAFTLEAVKITS